MTRPSIFRNLFRFDIHPVISEKAPSEILGQVETAQSCCVVSDKRRQSCGKTPQPAGTTLANEARFQKIISACALKQTKEYPYLNQSGGLSK